HLGSQILAFIGRNTRVPLATTPLEPARIADLKDKMLGKHDLNLFKFVLRVNRAQRDAGTYMQVPPRVDFSMLRDPGLRLEDMPRRRRNFLDLQSAIELFTPLY